MLLLNRPETDCLKNCISVSLKLNLDWFPKFTESTLSILPLELIVSTKAQCDNVGIYAEKYLRSGALKFNRKLTPQGGRY